MFIINEDNSIYITRGDVAFFSVATETEDGEAFKFHAGDVVRFKVFEKKACENVVLQKDFGIEEDTEEALIYLEEKDTKIGGVISKPVDYWYEVELNPYTDPQTIIGYDEDGAKVFRLYPEGNEVEDEEPITPEDIPVVDEELDLTSTRPVQNQAISRAILKIRDDVEARMNTLQEDVHSGLADARGQKVTNVAEPEEETDAATKKYVDGKDAETKQYVDDKDAETKQYADDKDAETKQYVDDTYGTNEVDPDVFGKRVYGLFRGDTGIYKMGNLIIGSIRLLYDHEFVNEGDVIIELGEAYKPAYSFRVVDTSLGLSLLFDAASCSIVADSHTGGQYEDLELEFNFAYICE